MSKETQKVYSVKRIATYGTIDELEVVVRTDGHAYDPRKWDYLTPTQFSKDRSQAIIYGRAILERSIKSTEKKLEKLKNFLEELK